MSQKHTCDLSLELIRRSVSKKTVRGHFFLFCWRIQVILFQGKGSNSVILIFASPFNVVKLLMKRICSSWSKFFPIRVDPISEGLFHSGKQTGSPKCCFPL